MNCPIKFKVGDKVVATGPIWRQDRRTTLLTGDTAIVSAVYQGERNPSNGHESPQIIALEVPSYQGPPKLPIGDIVCLESVPLKLA